MKYWGRCQKATAILKYSGCVNEKSKVDIVSDMWAKNKGQNQRGHNPAKLSPFLPEM
jgi:hypothetical protein